MNNGWLKKSTKYVFCYSNYETILTNLLGVLSWATLMPMSVAKSVRLCPDYIQK